MELTGKCKEAFDYWFIRQDYVNNTEHRMLNDNQLTDTAKNAHIIDFFDSKEIFIHVKRNCTGFKFNHWYCIITDVKGVHLNNFLKDESKEDDRNIILNCAIKKANKIYNLNYGRK